MSFNISSNSISANNYNVQATNKVATVNNGNLATNAANQSAFSSYIEQALAQVGIANPTNSSAPVITSANRANASQKSLSSFIQDLFSILSDKDTSQNSTTAVNPQVDTSQNQLLQAEENDNAPASSSINEAALAAYNAENSTTVGNIVANLKSLVEQLNINNASRNDTNNSSDKVQRLQNGFQDILYAQGASADNTATLGNFLQTLAQNLQGQSPLGIIINIQS